MHKVSKGIIAIAVVIVLTAFVYYRYTLKLLPAVRTEETPIAQNKVVADKPKEVSAEVGYPVPNDGYDNVRFTLTLDAQGAITDVREVAVETNEADEHQIEFAQGLLTVIKGKKLSELAPVDRIGKSTMTTDAFNSVIDKLKSQL